MSSTYVLLSAETKAKNMHSSGIKKKIQRITVYASLLGEPARIKHLGFRDDLMCRYIVKRWSGKC